MTRTPQAVLEEQNRALEAGDLEKIAEGYSESCIQIWNGEIRRGRSGVKDGFGHFFSELGEVKSMETTVEVFADNVLYLEWWADLGDRHCDGVDTFVFDDGFITAHTIKYDIKG